MFNLASKVEYIYYGNRGWIVRAILALILVCFFSPHAMQAQLAYSKAPYRQNNTVSRTINLNKMDVQDSQLGVLSYAFKTYSLSFDSQNQMGSLALGNVLQIPEEDVEPEVVGRALNYPNPFTQYSGTTIGYVLSKSMDITIFVYDMLGSMIFDETYYAGAPGGLKGMNRVQLDMTTFNGYQLSVGVYFYLICHQESVLARGKMAVVL